MKEPRVTMDMRVSREKALTELRAFAHAVPFT